MEPDEYLDGVRQMITDLRSLVERDGCVAAAWAISALEEYAFEVRGLQSEIERLKADKTALVVVLDDIGGLSRALRVGGPDPMDLEGLSIALTEAVDMAHDAIKQYAPAEVTHAESD